MKNWAEQITLIQNEQAFNKLALQAFLYQFKHIGIYKSYCEYLNIKPNEITHYLQIPFLPIEFFKNNSIFPEDKKAETIFTSSGTTGAITSQHMIADCSIYEKSYIKAFEQFYGAPESYCILALLPSYLERSGSSLVYMADGLIKLSKHPDSGFYLHNYQELSEKLKKLESSGQKTMLIGVSYALLDMTEQFPIPLKNTIIMETGGMKGKRKDMIKDELHSSIKNAFKVEAIHSEYGMTELLSQGYSKGNGVFKTPNWMKILIRDTYDPFSYVKEGESGGINVIDLANIYSCCFIETKDIGKLLPDNSFTILGRFDNSDVRGCNLMVE